MNYCESFCRTIQRLCNSGGGGLLPPEYQQVEYIYGTQCYINPGLTNQIPVEFECEAKCYSGSGYILGSFENGSRFFVQLFTGAGKTAVGYSGSYTAGNSISRNTYYKISGAIQNGLQTLYINDTQYINSAITGTVREKSIDIFGGYIETAHNNFAGEMKYIKLWSNGALIFDGIPCYRKSDNIAGFYDTVTEQLFASASSSNFGVGADV